VPAIKGNGQGCSPKDYLIDGQLPDYTRHRWNHRGYSQSEMTALSFLLTLLIRPASFWFNGLV